MSAVALDSLPLEILAKVCNCLYDDDYAGSLLAFALTRKSNHSTAKHTLARTIKFKVRLQNANDLLRTQVNRQIDQLRRNGTLASVRRLVIDRIAPSNPMFRPKQESQRQQSLLSYLEMHGEDETKPESYIAQPEDDYRDLELIERHNQDFPEEKHWRALARLINLLPGLTDLLFSVRHQFPRCMLQAVHRTAPQCRLHLQYFRLPTVHYEKLDACDIELASSPCLHSIQCSYPEEGINQMEHEGVEDGEDEEILKQNIHNAAIMGLVTQLAPALKQVGLEFPITRHKQPLPLQWFKNPQLPRGIIRRSKGSLQSLHISGMYSGGVNKAPLEGWSACTDLAVLRRLHIDKELQQEAVDCLATWDLPSLRALSFSIANLDESEGRDEYLGSLTAFLSKVSSGLVCLRIRDWAPSIALSAALGKHLRALHIKTRMCTTAMSYPLGADSVNEIFEISPSLEELSVSIRRTKGDAAEVAIYKALGRFPRLRKLFLELRVLEPPVSSRIVEKHLGSTDSQEHYIPWKLIEHEDNGAEELDPYDGIEDEEEIAARIEEDSWFLPFTRNQMKDLLISVAVDKDLAVAIFNLISTARGPDRLPTLEFLEILVDGWDARFELIYAQNLAVIKPYCLVLGQPLIIRRDPRREHRSELCVLEASDRYTGSQYRSRAYDEANDDDPLQPIFREIWPERSDLEFFSWTEDWHSFPLHIKE